MIKQELIDFEDEIAELFKAKKIKCPIHLSGGNEDELISIFKNISPKDYVFSTHRNHYHYLLHTGAAERLKKQILSGDSMHTCDPEHNFYSSSIVSGCVAIACGVALALKMKKSKQKVWCFVGDAGTDEGWFWEALRYSAGLPITFVVEDNNRSVFATNKQRWGGMKKVNIIAYKYKCGWPHVGCGEWVTF
ncbi:MAG: thiamine pyrophosphate-dependent enzyme [Candidatus Omnitrophota bacterium]